MTRNKRKIPAYFYGTEAEEVYLYGLYICDCAFLHNLAIHAMAHKGKRETYLTQMEEGAKTLLSHIEKIKTVHAKLETERKNDN